MALYAHQDAVESGTEDSMQATHKQMLRALADVYNDLVDDGDHQDFATLVGALGGIAKELRGDNDRQAHHELMRRMESVLFPEGSIHMRTFDTGNNEHSLRNLGEWKENVRNSALMFAEAVEKRDAQAMIKLAVLVSTIGRAEEALPINFSHAQPFLGQIRLLRHNLERLPKSSSMDWKFYDARAREAVAFAKLWSH